MGNFFNNLNNKLATFMIGRNGSDKLGRWCLGAAIVLACINIIIPNIACSVLSYALLARAQENEKFESLLSRNKDAGKGQNSDSVNKPMKKDTATTVYFTCDNCGQSLSVPKGKGTLKVTCPKCKHQTTIKS